MSRSKNTLAALQAGLGWSKASPTDETVVGVRKGIHPEKTFSTRNMPGSTVQRSNARAFPASDTCLHPPVVMRSGQGVLRKP